MKKPPSALWPATCLLARWFLILHFAFCIFHWPLQGQSTVQFYLVQFTGGTNDTTINLQAKNNPVIYHGNYYWWPQSGTNLATTNGFAQINLIPGQYDLGIAGCPQTWTITVTNSAVPLNAAGLTTSTLIYSGINTLTGNVVANDGHGNYSVNADANGAAAAATNGLGSAAFQNASPVHSFTSLVVTNSLLAGSLQLSPGLLESPAPGASSISNDAYGNLQFSTANDTYDYAAFFSSSANGSVTLYGGDYWATNFAVGAGFAFGNGQGIYGPPLTGPGASASETFLFCDDTPSEHAMIDGHTGAAMFASGAFTVSPAGVATGGFSGNGGGLTNISGPISMADGTLSNWYQTTALIPPQLLATLQAYWTNNPNTSYFNPLATNTDAQAQLGNWNLPSVTVTNAVALAPTNSGAVYYELTNAAGWTPSNYQTYKAITFVFNGGTLYSKASGSGGQVKFNLGPCCFWDGCFSNIIFNAVNGTAIIENYCFHDNRATIDVFNNTGANIEVNHCVIFSGFDTFHIFGTARIRHSLVYSASSGAAGNTCIRPANVAAGFYAEDSVFCAQGSASFNIAVAAETAGTVGVLKGCTFYAGTNLNAACNTIMAEGTNTVIFLPQSLGIPTNQIYTDGLGMVTTSETATLSVSPYLLGVVVANNPITTTSISANCFLTNGLTGQAGIMETNLTKGYMKLAQLPNIASINAEINISDVVGPGDQVEFLNAGTGASTNVSLASTATLICP